MRTHASENPTFVVPARLASELTAMPREVFGRSDSALPRRREINGPFRPDASTTLPSSFSRTSADRVRDRSDEIALPSSMSRASGSNSIGPRRARGIRNTEPALSPLARMERSDP